MSAIRESLANLGYINLGEIHQNLAPAMLVQEALKRGEGELAANGALSVRTGKYTGRSPEDRFIVETETTKETVDWGKVNKPISLADYEAIKRRQMAFLEGRDVFVFEGFIGTDPKYRLAVRVVNQYAWQNLFIRSLLVRPTEEELQNFQPDINLVCTPGFYAIPEIDHTHSEAFIILNLDQKEILIGGSSYAG